MLLHDKTDNNAFIIKNTNIYISLTSGLNIESDSTHIPQTHYNLTASFNKPLVTFDMVFKPLSLSESLSGLLSGDLSIYEKGQNFYIAFVFKENSNQNISSNIYLIPVSGIIGDEFKFFNTITSADIIDLSLNLENPENLETQLLTIADTPLIDYGYCYITLPDNSKNYYMKSVMTDYFQLKTQNGELDGYTGACLPFEQTSGHTATPLIFVNEANEANISSYVYPNVVSTGFANWSR